KFHERVRLIAGLVGAGARDAARAVRLTADFVRPPASFEQRFLDPSGHRGDQVELRRHSDRSRLCNLPAERRGGALPRADARTARACPRRDERPRLGQRARRVCRLVAQRRLQRVRGGDPSRGGGALQGAAHGPRPRLRARDHDDCGERPDRPAVGFLPLRLHPLCARARCRHRRGDERDRSGNRPGRMRLSRLSRQAAADRAAPVHAVRALAAEKPDAQRGNRGLPRLRHRTAMGMAYGGHLRKKGPGVLRVRHERDVLPLVPRGASELQSGGLRRHAGFCRAPGAAAPRRSADGASQVCRRVAGDAVPDGRNPGAQAFGVGITKLRIMRDKSAGGGVILPLTPAPVSVFSHVQTAAAQDAVASGFRRGMGMSHVMAWASLEAAPSKGFVFPPFSYPDATFAGELRELRRVGFDFVRFAVDPGPFLQWRDSRRDDLDRMLIGKVRQILASDLSVIVDFHPSDMHLDYLGEKIAAGADAPLFRDYLRLLARAAAALDALQSPRVALEIMNEPPPPARVWRPMLEAAYAAIRKAAPKLLLVLDGGEEGNFEGTTTLDGFRDDPNILFSFHYYRPWQFTHQGLAGMAAQYLTDVPYPARARPIEKSLEATAATIALANLVPSQKLEAKGKAREALESYRASSFDR